MDIERLFYSSHTSLRQIVGLYVSRHRTMPFACGRVRVRVIKAGVVHTPHTFLMGLCPKMKNEWSKWKNHCYEMKGDVGMSRHEKGR